MFIEELFCPRHLTDLRNYLNFLNLLNIKDFYLPILNQTLNKIQKSHFNRLKIHKFTILTIIIFALHVQLHLYFMYLVIYIQFSIFCNKYNFTIYIQQT